MFFTKAGKKRFQNDYHVAQGAFHGGDYEQMEQLMSKWSKKGFSEASDLLRQMWKQRSNKTTDKNLKQLYHENAMKMMKLAADQGNAKCQFLYGQANEFPEIYGLPTDYKIAFYYYSLAARQGDNRALNNLGCMYQFGYGVERDFEKAKALYQKAIEAGNPRGYLALGYMYRWGKGVDTDLYKAREQFYFAKSMAEEKFYLAKEAGEYEIISQHQETLKDCLEALDDIELEFACVESRQKKGVEQEKAEAKLLELANAGNERAQFELGIMCNGRKEYAKAMEWYKKAGENGMAGGMANVGSMYYFGEGVKKDYKLAFEYLTKAEQMTGHRQATYLLGKMYKRGYYVSKDLKMAKEYFYKAAKLGHKDAAGNLGYMYEIGEGVPKDYKKAVEYYLQAEDAGIMYVESRLGDLYAEGLGVEKDLNRAIELMSRAADKGNKYSKKRLQELYNEKNHMYTRL